MNRFDHEGAERSVNESKDKILSAAEKLYEFGVTAAGGHQSTRQELYDTINVIREELKNIGHRVDDMVGEITDWHEEWSEEEDDDDES